MRSERKAELSRSPAESFAQFLRWGKDWIRDHQRLSGGIGGGGVLFLIVWGGLTVFWGYQRTSGLVALDDGLQAISKSAPEKAIRQLQSATHRLSGQARRLALVQLGSVYEKQQEIEKAVTAYEQARGGGGEEHYLSQIALIKLAKIAQSKGDKETAKEHLIKAAKLDGPGKEEALLGVAQLLEEANDVEGARSYYQQFLDVAPGSPLQEVIEEKIE